MRRLTRTTAALLLLAGVTTGCGLGSTADDRKQAVEVAERLYPGQLKLLEARRLVFVTEVTFAVVGDPDAFVRFQINDGKCDGAPCERKLTRVLVQARKHAADWRLLAPAFQACGHPVVGVRAGITEPWIAAEATEATAPSLLAELGGCVRRWTRARADAGQPPTGASVTVGIVSPDRARRLPAARPGTPTLLHMTGTKVVLPLLGHTYQAAVYQVRDGVAEPTPSSFRPVRPFREQQEFTKKIHAAAIARLRPIYPDAVPATYHGIWYYERGTMSRLTGTVRFCEHPPAKGKSCAGDGSVAVTATPDGDLLELVR
ncbi:SCO7460 family lipoprotein [Actinomadura hibisca]|uniref:SCO7460 family lipoprotein n=1 Tax=Actinomadura hibisca TaxID=68565 RepID=UPI00082CA74A|nr:hypothetical protein [Actinomadura hibisca]